MKVALTEFQEQQQTKRLDQFSSTAACVIEASSDSSTIATLGSSVNESKAAVQITTDVPIGCITLDSFVSIIDQGRQAQIETDECYLHFLSIVNEYQTRCGSEGKYLLAKDFMDHLVCLRKEEENRVVEKVTDMIANDRVKLVAAHSKQLDEFNHSWDEYLAGFEQKSKQYMAEMEEIHEEQLNTLHQQCMVENKPKKKWSKDLMDCRKSLENVAKQASTGRSSVSHKQLYREAQQIKQLTDALHEKAEADMNSKLNSVLVLKGRNVEKKQKTEKAVLMKRIETKRREVSKKREEDTARLVQRNRNIIRMIDAKNVRIACFALKMLVFNSNQIHTLSHFTRNWSAHKLPRISSDASSVCSDNIRSPNHALNE